MDWFCALALQRDSNEALLVKSDVLWESLKLIMNASVTIYMKRYPRAPTGHEIQFDGSPKDQAIISKHSVNDKGINAPVPICSVTVAFKPPILTATYSTKHAPRAFTVGTSSEGYVNIFFRDEPIYLDHAVALILRPVFFPESPG